MDWKKIKRYLPIIGIILFVYILIKLDIVKIFEEIKKINLSYFILALFLSIILLIAHPLKWFVIAKKQKIDIPFKDAIKINIISCFYGFITPAKIGGIMRADYLKKYKGDAGKGLSNFVIDKVLDFCSVFLLILLFGLIFYNKIIPKGYWWFILSLFILMIILFSLFYKKESSKFFLRFVYNKITKEKLKEKLRIIFNSFYKDIPSVSFLFFCLIINLSIWVLDYLVIYFIGVSLGINVNFIYFLIILPASTLVAQIPITINGFGTREVTMISLFGLFGTEAIKIFSMSILSIIIMNIIPSIIAIIFILRDRKNEIHNI